MDIVYTTFIKMNSICKKVKKKKQLTCRQNKKSFLIFFLMVVVGRHLTTRYLPLSQLGHNSSSVVCSLFSDRVSAFNRDPPASTSQVAGITDIYIYTRLILR
jgi:hypothetical protein